MKVREFVEKYNKNQRIDIAKELEVKQYLGIEQKRRIAGLVLDGCTSVENGRVHINSVDKYLLFTIATLSAYTNLEFEEEAIVDYDALCESGVMVKIVDTFRTDYQECQVVLDMMTADLMNRNVTFDEAVVEFLNGLSITLQGAIESVVDKLDLGELDITPDNLNTILNLLEGR